jgi:hypothetical protein
MPATVMQQEDAPGTELRASRAGDVRCRLPFPVISLDIPVDEHQPGILGAPRRVFVNLAVWRTQIADRMLNDVLKEPSAIDYLTPPGTAVDCEKPDVIPGVDADEMTCLRR